MSPKLTHARLLEVLYYDPETGIFTHRTSRHYLIKAGEAAGYDGGRGYLILSIDGRRLYAHRLAWFYVHGVWPEDGIDHIDGDPSNTRLANLREASQAKNLRNKRIQSNNICGLKGVSWHKQGQKWMARITTDGVITYLGLFSTKEEAHQAYCGAAKAQHGEFARFG